MCEDKLQGQIDHAPFTSDKLPEGLNFFEAAEKVFMLIDLPP
jgi:hypothetical protein